MRVPIVTALRERGSSRIQIDLDGVPWRVVPLDAVVEARLGVDVSLDRARARDLNRAIRRAAALATARRALRWSDHTRATLDRRLSERGVRTIERTAAVELLERIGAVDDARVAFARAETLVARGAGDAMIRTDLLARGIGEDVVATALAGIEPEAARARRWFAERGGGPAAARWLGSRGFEEESLEPLTVGFETDAVE